MQTATQTRLVLVTAPNLETARSLAADAVGQHLAACANLVTGLESIYWWEGKIQTAQEIQILFKTVHTQVAALEKLILEQHPYDTPEILVLAISEATPRYLDWMLANTRTE